MSRGGAEYLLTAGDYTAVITQVGAGVRVLRHDERDLVIGYGAEQVRPLFRGALLAPWPNRVVDGRYQFDGTSHQLDITEPARGHALHGLVPWERFDLLDRDDASIRLGHRVVPRTGWPFELELSVAYDLGADGLGCSVSARNIGGSPAPYGVGPHPYLLAGPGRVDDWTLDLPAGQVLAVTEDRLVPTGLEPVDDGPFDFRGGRRIAATEIDHAFTRLEPDASGSVRVTVRSDDGAGVACAWDPGVLPWVQVHTADLPDPQESRRGLAVEPMTCPPDAYNSGTDLVRLEPGDEHVASWTISAT